MANSSLSLGQMSELTKKLTQTKFFSQEFNAAIIDGPLRIYYAERHEDQVLPFYFSIQEVLADQGFNLTQLTHAQRQVFVMFYPTQQSYLNAFNWGDAWGQSDFESGSLCVGVDFSAPFHKWNELTAQIVPKLLDV